MGRIVLRRITQELRDEGAVKANCTSLMERYKADVVHTKLKVKHHADADEARPFYEAV